jgi:hypothetical protein
MDYQKNKPIENQTENFTEGYRESRIIIQYIRLNNEPVQRGMNYHFCQVSKNF